MPRVRAAPRPLVATTLLQLMRLASPALPVGGFSYSEGLEAAVESRLLTSEPDVRQWLSDQLHLSLARCELPVVAAAFKAWSRKDPSSLDELNRWMIRTRETAELRQQTEQMGRSLMQWLRHEYPQDADVATLGSLAPAPTWPVAFALAVLHSGAPLRESLLTFAFSWAENMVQAAVKAVPLGQTAGQRILQALAQQIPDAADQAMRAADSERQAFTPMLAILSAQHETQYSRLFRS